MKVISGGQTGVDRAALDAALELGIPCGGWCPKGRLAEDGELARRYPLKETPLSSYPQRTEYNVRDSDGTLVLTFGKPSGGTALTIALARRWHKPCLIVDIKEAALQPEKVAKWASHEKIRVLNVAGPRASTTPNAYTKTKSFLLQTFPIL